MNPKPVVALDVTGEDVQLAYDYFESRSAGSGERFLQRYLVVTDLIAANPKQFPIRFDDYRRALVPKSNQAVYYYEQPALSVIVAVVDARRDPRLIRDLIRGRRED